MPFNTETGSSLQSIRFRIMNIPVDYSFKTLLMGDINLASYYYGHQEIPGVLAYLSLLIRRISVHNSQHAYQYGHFDLLLADLYALMTALTSPPHPMESGNSPEPAGLQPSRAVPTPPVPELVPKPEPFCPEPVEPGPVESVPEEPEVMEPEPIEQSFEQDSIEEEPIEQELVEEEPIEQEPMELEPVLPELIESEPVIREDTMIPTSIPKLEKPCLRWNFPVSPSR